LKCRNVVRGLSLVLHDPEGSHYIDLELRIWKFYRDQVESQTNEHEKAT